MISKKTFLIVGLISSLSASLFVSTGKAQPPKNLPVQGPAMSPPRPPEPPAVNPHPPLTEIDKKRVKFAEQAIILLLKKPLSSSMKLTAADTSSSFQNKDLNCIRDIQCAQKDTSFTNELINFHAQLGEIVEFKQTHLIPWSIEKFNSKTETKAVQPFKGTGGEDMPSPISKGDEYIIHSYVKFNKTDGWNHLDVILSEDKNGNIYLRHFFTTPMVPPNIKMPPGVVC